MGSGVVVNWGAGEICSSRGVRTWLASHRACALRCSAGDAVVAVGSHHLDAELGRRQHRLGAEMLRLPVGGIASASVPGAAPTSTLAAARATAATIALACSRAKPKLLVFVVGRIHTAFVTPLFDGLALRPQRSPENAARAGILPAATCSIWAGADCCVTSCA